MPVIGAVASLAPESVSRFLVGGFQEVLRSWMEDQDATDLRGRVTAALDTVDALLGAPTQDPLKDITRGFTVGKHHTPNPRIRPRSPADVRNMALVMAGLTAFVIAMIASYSGAFAKPTLHHMTVAVAGPNRSSTPIRVQDTLAVTQVADDAAARSTGLRAKGRRRIRRRSRWRPEDLRGRRWRS